jgi:ADP-ribosylation factor-like protein 2
MGLLKIIRKLKKKENEMRILMLGLDNAGKTTILLKFCGEDICEIPPTVGFNIKTIAVDRFKVNVWDVGGQKSIRSFWRNYFDQTDGLVWVVDSSDHHRLLDCKNELSMILKEERLCGASLLILANKQDLPGAVPIGEISRILDLDSVKSSRRCAVFPCSAYDAESVQTSLSWVVRDIGDRMYTLRY